MRGFTELDRDGTERLLTEKDNVEAVKRKRANQNSDYGRSPAATRDENYAAKSQLL